MQLIFNVVQPKRNVVQTTLPSQFWSERYCADGVTLILGIIFSSSFFLSSAQNPIRGYHRILKWRLVSDWLMTCKQASSLAPGSKLKYCFGPAGNKLILVQARCKHIPDELGKWHVNIVTTIFKGAGHTL